MRSEVQAIRLTTMQLPELRFQLVPAYDATALSKTKNALDQHSEIDPVHVFVAIGNR